MSFFEKEIDPEVSKKLVNREIARWINSAHLFLDYVSSDNVQWAFSMISNRTHLAAWLCGYYSYDIGETQENVIPLINLVSSIYVSDEVLSFEAFSNYPSSNNIPQIAFLLNFLHLNWPKISTSYIEYRQGYYKEATIKLYPKLIDAGFIFKPVIQKAIEDMINTENEIVALRYLNEFIFDATKLPAWVQEVYKEFDEIADPACDLYSTSIKTLSAIKAAAISAGHPGNGPCGGKRIAGLDIALNARSIIQFSQENQLNAMINKYKKELGDLQKIVTIIDYSKHKHIFIGEKI